jgi:hypothetical protein
LNFYIARPKACSRFGSLDPNIAAGLGGTTQSLQPVWVVRPKYCSRFGSLDPKLAAVWVVRPKYCSWFGSLDPKLAAVLDRLTQTSWQDGPWPTRPNPHYGDGFGSADPNLPQFTQSNPKIAKKKRKNNFQSCPHRPCALTHRVCAGLCMRRKKIKKRKNKKKELAKLPS